MIGPESSECQPVCNLGDAMSFGRAAAGKKHVFFVNNRDILAVDASA